MKDRSSVHTNPLPSPDKKLAGCSSKPAFGSPSPTARRGSRSPVRARPWRANDHDAQQSDSNQMTPPQQPGKTPQPTRTGRPRDPSRGSTTAAEDSGSNAPADRHLVTDPRAMRALAHPLRVALLEAIRRDGEITATRAAELLGESPGNMSWHLQTLAKYGFVEETGKGRGRSRPWRLVTASNRFRVDIDDPAAGAAGDVLVDQFVARAVDKQRQWMVSRNRFAPEWRE